MQTINLKQYYPFCTEDTFVEVSDEIVEAFLLDKRAEAARERKMYRYKAFYSLDCDDGIENAAIGWAQPSPEDCLMEKEAQAEYAELLRRLRRYFISLRRAEGISRRFQPQRTVFGIFGYAGNVLRFCCPEDTSVHPFGNPISHSTQSGLRTAFSESDF